MAKSPNANNDLENKCDQFWSITNMNFEHNNQENELNYQTNSSQKKREMSFGQEDAKMENSFSFKNTTKQTNKLQAFYSIAERLRHFLHINMLLNKYTVIFSLLGYLSDLLLFVSLNLCIFSNKHFLYEYKSVDNQTTTQIETETSAEIANGLNGSLHTLHMLKPANLSLSHLTNANATRTIKQSYLTLQILVVFVFFICFILSYLIKFQFKYHRWAISLYGYDIETTNQQQQQQQQQQAKDKDGVDRDSLASTTTASHFSSSNSQKLCSMLKKIANRVFTKLASIVLNFAFGYQFCQNCFIQKPSEIETDSYAIFVHFFILLCVLVRCLVALLKKKNSINFGKNLKKLQQKALYDSKCNLNKNYYFNYYTYLMKYNQSQCNQLKQHQNNKSTFRIFQLDDVSLFVGFLLSLFHLFYKLKSIELIFVFMPLLFTLILFRLKSLLNAAFNLCLFLLSILFISKTNAYSITDLTQSMHHPNNTNSHSSNQSLFELIISQAQLTGVNQINQSSIINLLSFNLLTFVAFLLTLYFRSIVNIYYCTLNSLERWNISFLCNVSVCHRLAIYSSCLAYSLFSIVCCVTLSVRFKSWSFLIVPLYLFFTVLWCSFQLLSMINLSHLMNKVADCYLLLSEANSLTNTNSFENASTSCKHKSHASQLNQLVAGSNRDSLISQSSSTNNNSNSNSNNHNNTTRDNKSKLGLRMRKYLIRLLRYEKVAGRLNNRPTFNVPIHRILSYKGVRHLASISYRIMLYCFVQTIFMSPFAFATNSPLTIGLYLIALSVNLIWLSLLYLFPKSKTGTCIAYALVAPPLVLSIYNAATPSASLFDNTTTTAASSRALITDTKRSRTKANTLMCLPFNYQQALSERCAFLLNRIQAFLHFHLIENFGCDLGSTGLNRDFLEQKLRVYFEKCCNDGSYYNTYILYYCGPTSPLTHNLAFVDGNELSIEQIVKIWKEIHCGDESLTKRTQHQESSGSCKSDKNSRLILILDAENTNKSLHYIKSELNEPNVFVALQTVKYNYNLNKFNFAKSDKNSDTKLILKQQKKKAVNTMAPPGSPQAIPGTYFDSYLNIGKFTLDWIKSNCNPATLAAQHNHNLNTLDYFLSGNHQHFDQTKQINEQRESDEDEDYDDDDDDDDDNDDDDDDQNDDDEEDCDSVDFNNENKTNKNKSKQQNSSDSFFYEAKCAFSKYWTNYTFDSSDSSLANDLNQFWSLYYPYAICRPMLKLINCPVFYIKIDFVKNIYFLLKRLKAKIIPVHEYDTGHGFKLFTS